MILNLFNNMDFILTKFIYLKFLIWLSGFLALILIFFSLNQEKDLFSLLNSLKNVVIGIFNKEFVQKNKFFIKYFFKTALIIFILKLWGLGPGTFGVRCQFLLIFILSLNFWLMIKISSLEFKLIRFIKSYTPQGSPNFLVPLLKFIEVISKFIRPLTLTLRLCIKMTTGHILLNLLSLRFCFNLVNTSWFIIFVLIILIRFYLIFEIGICLIQGIVFNLLLRSYSEEHT